MYNKKKLTVREASLQGLSLIVHDTILEQPQIKIKSQDDRDNLSTDSVEEDKLSDEPGSPMFRDALVFSSQVQLNDLFRDRRPGLRRMDMTVNNRTGDDEYME